jgi:predicted nucleotidyltransferase
MVAVKEANLRMLRQVAKRLEPLLDRLVFLGGCTTALLMTDVAPPDVRVTDDVDVIVEVLSRTDYWKLEEQLRECGCVQDVAEEITCRWILDGLKLDVRPTDERILGFGNRWHSDAIKWADSVSIGDGLVIRVVKPAYFIATKLEAFFGRGNLDYRGSHDLEDIVTVIDGRVELVEELSEAASELRDYVSATFASFLAEKDFQESLAGHMPPDPASQNRLPILWQRLKDIAALQI